MEISVTGWARDLGPTRLFNHQIRHANTDQPTNLARYERLKLGSFKNRVELETFTSTRLNGDYRIRITFSHDDILHLFLACYPNLRATLELALSAGMEVPKKPLP